ncbi:6-hydroxycyclohex-1-ene-1-carbonyl-CoA dehydrogenase [uncultured Desulfosarcina sp.]|uniref:6-hydroxycyclohex-1-ene-1-carbonyl-CoA dehydrogenase n=1 Tax=uncultured Desulfosarcina sp. TaxID=218289 RepID=UPI0029C7E4C9|nr:6-hydroxycyclohex-1-ene-1-carbonyl-CoA dehydrogenase [uncultured Desulfosarcina sp.]
MASMISWQMTEPGKPLEKVEAPIPDPGPGEVLVKVAGCGVCHTDLGFYYNGVKTKSPLPLTLGHEISGVVTAAGPDARQWEGKAVIIPAVMPCGKCDVCNRDLGNICTAQKMPGNDIQGGFASHIVVPSDQLCPVPVDDQYRPVGEADVSLAQLSVVADALTTPYQAIVDAGLSADDTAIFVGVGGVGGFGAQIAKAFGALVVAIDVDPVKLDALAPVVDKTFNAAEMAFKDLRKAVSAFVKEQGKRRTEWKIFETSGTAAGQKTAFGLMTFGGNLSVVGFTMDTVEIRLSNLMAFHATARGNWGCLTRYYAPVRDLVLSGQVKMAPFVKTFPLSDINTVFDMVHHKKIVQRAIMVP